MDIPVVSLDAYLTDPSSPEAQAEAAKAAESLILTGALIVKDSRAPKVANDRFQDLFEDYFAQGQEALKKDERPEVGYQVVSMLINFGHLNCTGADVSQGVTLENTEKPKCGSDEECLSVIAGLMQNQRPLDITGHGADPKCRFFHRMSVSPPYNSAFPVSTAPNVVPDAFSDTWAEKLDEWGSYMKQRCVSGVPILESIAEKACRCRSVEGVALMVAQGLGLDPKTFLEAGKYGLAKISRSLASSCS